MSRHILIDADVLVYQFAHSCQVATKWDENLWTWHAKEDEARAKLAEYMDELLKRTKADELYLALSDTTFKFRCIFAPDYKGNRAGAQRPMLFTPLREFLIEEYDAVIYPRLEGDDALGIMATDPECWGTDDEVVICSIDKDMLTIPGLHYNWTKAEQNIVSISADEGRWNVFYQALTGDAVDGYKGCPSVGPVRARRILAAGDTPAEWWQLVADTFTAQGLSEDVALMNVRCAHILRYGDYNEDDNKVRLFDPTGQAAEVWV